MLDKKSPPLTIFEYGYRDASNYKSYGHILLAGALSIEERKEVISRLEGEKYFIAEQLEIPALYETLYEFSGGPTDSDHCWHEFVRLGEHRDSRRGDYVWGTAERLLSKFRTVSEWDLRLSPHLAIV